MTDNSYEQTYNHWEDGNIVTSITYTVKPKGYISPQTNNQYDNGLIVSMGMHTDKKYRNKGYLKQAFYKLLSTFPDDITIHYAIKNKFMLNMFLRVGFMIVDKIDYWGKPNKCILLELKHLDKSLIK